MTEFPTAAGVGTGVLALPPNNSGPGVLLLHAWWGLNPFFSELATRLAHEGYVVFAPDLNDGNVVTTVEDAEALMGQRDNDKTAQTVLAASDFLRKHLAVTGERIGVIGFSMGAAWAIWLSAERPADVEAVTLFYGAQPADFSTAQAAYQGHFAEADTWEPLDGVQAMERDMTSAGRDVTIHIYPGTAHWFVESDRPEYNHDAAELAWERTVAFLNEQLNNEQS